MPIERNPNAQSVRTLRWSEARALAHVEQGGMKAVHDAYADADVPVLGSIDVGAGRAFLVEGFDRFQVYMDWTKGNADGFGIRLQACAFDSSTDGDFYDVHEARFSSELVPWERKLTTAPTGQYIFDVNPVLGTYMRLTLYAIGAVVTDSRAVLAVARVTTTLP